MQKPVNEARPDHATLARTPRKRQPNTGRRHPMTGRPAADPGPPVELLDGCRELARRLPPGMAAAGWLRRTSKPVQREAQLPFVAYLGIGLHRGDDHRWAEFDQDCRQSAIAGRQLA
jgi:hypothetical protein